MYFLKFNPVLHDRSKPRRGWQLRGLSNVESVSDHMYQMSVMGYDDHRQDGSG